jgi:7 transmembrane sweet-taste receptor of 3 GCPR
MIYGSLLIKTNRIARLLAISKKRFPKKKLKFMSPFCQVILAFILISIESVISITMLFVIPPETELKYPQKTLNLLVCKESPTTILSPLAFIFLLIIMCTCYAFKTRNVPENFNETKFVGFAIYTTCVIWIAFFPIYYGSEMQIITKCLCISLSSIMTLIFMFFPKIYIILLHPEKNIRALFTTSKSIRCHIGATRHSNISHKTSSSISSTHGPSSIEFEPTIHRSLKKTSSSQTSTEKLTVSKTDSSCSPIKDDIFDSFIQEINGCPNDIIMNNSYQIMRNADYRRIPTSPNHVKIKNHKVHIKESFMNGNLNLHHPMKPHRSSKHHHKPKRKVETQNPILCVECLEMEKKNVKIIPNHAEIQFARLPKKSPIFTVEKIPLNSKQTSFNERRKVAISEESLSECSISDTTCKLKRITINLNQLN